MVSHSILITAFVGAEDILDAQASRRTGRPTMVRDIARPDRIRTIVGVVEAVEEDPEKLIPRRWRVSIRPSSIQGRPVKE